MNFEVYLSHALDRAKSDEANRQDDTNLQWVNSHCRRGVKVNSARITEASFLEDYLWCVGSTQKDYAVHSRFWKDQIVLFRECNAARIVADSSEIRSEYEKSKCYLSPKTVDAMLETANRITSSGWDQFQARYLVLPREPEAETPAAWNPTYRALRELKEVGHVISWYLIRNLFGGPFFKPDIHIKAIADHFFPDQKDPLEYMGSEVRRVWPQVCSDSRLLPVHLGEIDYILWWYRRSTGVP